MYTVYFLKSLQNSTFYTGITEKDPSLRLKEHNSGSNDWTKRNGPFELVYYEIYHCKHDATSREKFYKTGIGRKVRNVLLSQFSK